MLIKAPEKLCGIEFAKIYFLFGFNLLYRCQSLHTRIKISPVIKNIISDMIKIYDRVELAFKKSHHIELSSPNAFSSTNGKRQIKLIYGRCIRYQYIHVAMVGEIDSAISCNHQYLMLSEQLLKKYCLTRL